MKRREFLTGGVIAGPVVAMLSPAICRLHASEPEVVVPLDTLARMYPEGIKHTVTIEIDGKEIGRVLAEQLPGIVRRIGLK